MSHHFGRDGRVNARFVRIILCACLGVSAAWPAAAQASRPAPKAGPNASSRANEETIEIAGGWALLAQGQRQQAVATASRVLERFPRSAAALSLAVEADIVQGGALQGLARYERWLGARSLEEPSVLRRVALAVLHEALSAPERSARAEAWRSLSADGETVQVPFARDLGTPADIDGLASLGDERAVRALAADIPAVPAARLRAIEALGASGSELAVEPISRLLQDSRMDVRSAVVEALGKIGGPNALAAIKPMLSDRSALVRGKAAGALYRLGDASGLSVLDEMLASADPTAQLLAAEGMAARPDGAWSSVVTGLTGNENPEIRLWAARVIGPQDPDLARRVLDALLLDPNPAIRDMAALGYGDIVAGCDLRTLRGLLRQPAAITRVRAAAQILATVR
jgi:HEAT repeat protein